MKPFQYFKDEKNGSNDIDLISQENNEHGKARERLLLACSELFNFKNSTTEKTVEKNRSQEQKQEQEQEQEQKLPDLMKSNFLERALKFFSEVSTYHRLYNLEQPTPTDLNGLLLQYSEENSQNLSSNASKIKIFFKDFFKIYNDHLSEINKWLMAKTSQNNKLTSMYIDLMGKINTVQRALIYVCNKHTQTESVDTKEAIEKYNSDDDDLNIVFNFLSNDMQAENGYSDASKILTQIKELNEKVTSKKGIEQGIDYLENLFVNSRYASYHFIAVHDTPELQTAIGSLYSKIKTSNLLKNKKFKDNIEFLHIWHKYNIDNIIKEFTATKSSESINHNLLSSKNTSEKTNLILNLMEHLGALASGTNEKYFETELQELFKKNPDYVAYIVGFILQQQHQQNIYVATDDILASPTSLKKFFRKKTSEKVYAYMYKQYGKKNSHLFNSDEIVKSLFSFGISSRDKENNVDKLLEVHEIYINNINSNIIYLDILNAKSKVNTESKENSENFREKKLQNEMLDSFHTSKSYLFNVYLGIIVQGTAEQRKSLMNFLKKIDLLDKHGILKNEIADDFGQHIVNFPHYKTQQDSINKIIKSDTAELEQLFNALKEFTVTSEEFNEAIRLLPFQQFTDFKTTERHLFFPLLQKIILKLLSSQNKEINQKICSYLQGLNLSSKYFKEVVNHTDHSFCQQKMCEILIQNKLKQLDDNHNLQKISPVKTRKKTQTNSPLSYNPLLDHPSLNQEKLPEIVGTQLSDEFDLEALITEFHNYSIIISNKRVEKHKTSFLKISIDRSGSALRDITVKERIDQLHMMIAGKSFKNFFSEKSDLQFLDEPLNKLRQKRWGKLDQSKQTIFLNAIDCFQKAKVKFSAELNDTITVQMVKHQALTLISQKQNRMFQSKKNCQRLEEAKSSLSSKTTSTQDQKSQYLQVKCAIQQLQEAYEPLTWRFAIADWLNKIFNINNVSEKDTVRKLIELNRMMESLSLPQTCTKPTLESNPTK